MTGCRLRRSGECNGPPTIRKTTERLTSVRIGNKQTNKPNGWINRPQNTDRCLERSRKKISNNVASITRVPEREIKLLQSNSPTSQLRTFRCAGRKKNEWVGIREYRDMGPKDPCSELLQCPYDGISFLFNRSPRKLSS
jgi:hypothetical protein